MTEIQTPAPAAAAQTRRGRPVLNRDVVMWIVLLLVLVVASLTVRRFATPITAGFLLLDVMPALLIAMPMTLIMITGDIDLSVASIVGLTSASLGVLTDAGMDFGLAVLVSLLIGAACGAFNGVMTAYVGLRALAVTIGTLALYRGLALVVIGDRAVTAFPAWATGLATGKLGATGVPTVTLLAVVVIVVFYLVLHRSPFGRGIYALGNSIEAARFVAVDVARTRLLLFIASGLVSAMVGVFWTLRYTSARSDNAAGLELAIIAAVVLGGVSVFGGRGSVLGSVAGVMIIGVVNYALRLNRVPEVILVMITGLLLIASVVLPALSASLNDWWHRRRQTQGVRPAAIG